MPLVDVWHFDLKATGPDMYREWVGTDGDRIEQNLQLLLERNARVRLRCPIVPGVQDTAIHTRRLQDLEDSGRFETVERLPYHATGISKYRDLGLSVPLLPKGSGKTDGSTL